jgi:hypothetical protein
MRQFTPVLAFVAAMLVAQSASAQYYPSSYPRAYAQWHLV